MLTPDATRQLLILRARRQRHVTEAKATHDQLQDLVCDLVGRGEASWADIGVALGITRQAAHERFSRPAAAVPPGGELLPTPPDGASKGARYLEVTE